MVVENVYQADAWNSQPVGLSIWMIPTIHISSLKNDHHTYKIETTGPKGLSGIQPKPLSQMISPNKKKYVPKEVGTATTKPCALTIFLQLEL